MIEGKKIAAHLFCLTAFGTLSACSIERIRNEAQDQVRQGSFENALKTYEEGLSRYPDSVALRSGLLSSRETIFAQLMSSAAAARTNGNDQLAEQIVNRALSINSNDERAKAMKLDIERDRRQKIAIETARDLLAKGFREKALITIEAALKDNPKNQDLIAIQRQLELEDKQFQLDSAQLAETRPISLDFRDANLRMVMEVLTRNSGINFVIDKDVRQDLRTTVFLKNTKLEDALNLIATTNQLAYKALDSGTILIYPKTAEKTKEYQDLVIRAFYLSSADAKQTSNLLKSMLKVRDPFIDEKLNMIIIRETPQTIRLAERLIALHDLSEPEVMMEMEVLEVQKSSLTQLGINFPDTLTLTPLLPAGSSAMTVSALKNINQKSIGVNTPSIGINLHRDVGDANILANPKVRAKNHEKAKIMIGDRLPVVTTTGNANNNGFISESVQYVEVGLKLNVEPSIFLDDEVAIKLGLEVSSLVNTVKTAAGSTVYQIGTRNVETVLKLKDGETQLLAGLINRSEQSSANRIPGIGDLPLIGRLFSSQKDNGQRSEIVLSITPHIIRNIRRPDINQTEFWSGTENDVRSRPLTLAGSKTPTNEKKYSDRPGMIPGQSPPSSIPSSSVNADQKSDIALTLETQKESSVGQTFNVNVNIKTANPIRGIPLQLQFDSKCLEILDADEGNFLKSDNVITSKTKTLEQKEGRVSLAVLRNTANDIKGEGTLMTFKFKALAAGACEMKIASAKAIAAQPISIFSLPDPIKINIK